MKRRFAQIDFFASKTYRGNPVAVVVDCDGPDVGEMQQFAKLTNLSETIFLFSPTNPSADYRVRFLYPQKKCPLRVIQLLVLHMRG